jgi:tRNA G18 (ribose-2'-O)-methylase SpoU
VACLPSANGIRERPQTSSISANIFPKLVTVDMNGTPLQDFVHPKSAVYILGAEDYGLPNEILERTDRSVSLEFVQRPAYNVAVAGSIVMYHRCFCRRAQPISTKQDW